MNGRIPKALLPVLILGVLLGLASVAGAQQAAGPAKPEWVTAWSMALQPNPDAKAVYENQTLRVRLVPAVAGRKVRVLLSNAFGSQPLLIAAASIVALGPDGNPRPDGIKSLVFGGWPRVRVFPGGEALSDERDMALDPDGAYEVRVYVPRKAAAATIHAASGRVAGMAPAELSATGDYADPPNFPGAAPVPPGVVARVDVQPLAATQAIVVLGSTEAARPGGWVDELGARLRQQEPKDRALVNLALHNNAFARSSIAGGPSLVSRFPREALQVIGARYLVLALGDVDFGEPGSVNARGEAVDLRMQLPAPEFIYALRSLIARARSHGLKVIGATLAPFSAVGPPGYHDEWKERMRRQLNHWIRSGGAFDAVIDIDRAVADARQPERLDARFDDGAGRLNAAGARAVAQSISLDAFR